MKRFVLAAITLALVAVNPAASADRGSNGGGGSYHGGGNSGGNSYHGTPSAPPPQGKNNAGRRPHYGNGSGNNGYYAGNPPQGKNNAGRRPHYGNGSGYYYPARYPNKGYGHYPYYPARPYYGYRPIGYPAYYGYPYYYGNHNNNNNSNWPAYVIGGAVLGSVLTTVYNNSQTQQVAPVNQVVVAPQGRHLLRDLNGNCYERSTDGAGNELRTELPPAACNW